MSTSASTILVVAAALLCTSACSSADEDDAATGGSGASGSASVGGSGASGGSGATGGSASSASGGSAGAGSGGAAGFDDYYVDLTLPSPSPSPIDVPGVTFHEDIAYGSDPAMKFDLFRPAATTPTPLIVFVHGGGFTGGDKTSGYDAGDVKGVKQVLAAGVAYASINYRLLEEVDSEGVLKSLGDSRRVLQFIRHHAGELDIDHSRIALRGGSAGAGTSLWLAFHDDMLDAGAMDPVSQESTRVVAVAANATQATYDLVKWSTVVFVDYGIDLMTSVAALGMEQRLASFYGLPTTTDLEAQLETPAIVAYRAEVEMLDHMSPDDPPFYVHNTLAEEVPSDQGALFHHPYHARALRDRAAEVGIACTAKIEALDVDDSPGITDWSFLLETL
jgi:para-nitrobenzyl esterase